MTPREATAGAMAFFETCDDIGLLHELIGEVAPRAKKMIGAYIAKGGEESIPGPADLRSARTPLAKTDAVKVFRMASDFQLLQVMARAIGQRIEAIEIAASAEFPTGTRVRVPDRPAYPATARRLQGQVEASGTVLQVLLDNGETWQGPPSLAELAGRI
jgi:hypothetical protein